MLQGMVPHFSDEAAEDGGITAAKRLLYVIGSRARKHLHLISEQRRARGRYGVYSTTDVLLGLNFDYDIV